MNKFTIRTGGFGLYLFLIIGALLGVGIGFIIWDETGGSYLEVTLCVIVFLLLIVYIIAYILKNKICVDETGMLIQSGRFPWKQDKVEVSYETIDYICLSRFNRRNWEEELSERQLQMLQDFLQTYKRKENAMYASKSAIVLMPLIIIVKKDDSIVVVSTKPYAKKDVRTLMKLLSLQVSVEIQNGLL